MFRRIFAMLLALTMLACVPASAESIFTLPTEEEAAIPAPQKAPNYGLMTGAQPVTQTTLEDGSTQMVYKPVTDEDYLAFGARLAELGFFAVERKAENGTVTMMVANDDIWFYVAYTQKQYKMTLTYPEFVAIEQPTLVNPFAEGYVEVELGETLRAVKKGEAIFDITFTAIYKGEEARAIDKEADYVIGFKLDVLDNDSVQLWEHFMPNIQYVTMLNRYVYDDPVVYSGNQSNQTRLLYYQYSSWGSHWTGTAAKSLTRYPDCYLCVPTHSRVYKSNDGIVALTFKLPGYDLPFVLYIRGGDQ